MDKHGLLLTSLTTIWKSDLSDKIKQEIFQAVAVSVLQYRYSEFNETPGEKA